MLSLFSKKVGNTAFKICRKISKQEGEFGVIFETLQAYKAIHGNLSVPESFIVPKGDTSYPVESWGMNLSQFMKNVRASGSTDLISKLKMSEAELTPTSSNVDKKTTDVHDDFPYSPPYEVIFAAVKAYKSVHGNMEIPNSFIVPLGDVNYPKESWGRDLGHDLRNPQDSSDFDELNEKIEEEDKLELFIHTFPAMAAFHANHGHINIPDDFVVPDNDSNYPSDTWGVALGKDALEELGEEMQSALSEHGLKLDEVKAMMEKYEDEFNHEEGDLEGEEMMFAEQQQEEKKEEKKDEKVSELKKQRWAAIVAKAAAAGATVKK